MQINNFINILKHWIDEKTTGIVTIRLYQGGIHKVKIEKEVK